MEKNEEEQSEHIEDYCRQLGLQLRDEPGISSTMLGQDSSQMSVLGATVAGEKTEQSGQPISSRHTKLGISDKNNFQCKKCDKNFTNSRQFLKHKCVLKTDGETQTKTKSKKRARKPRVKSSEGTEGVCDKVNYFSFIDDL